jgi:hypothetical protein
MFEEREKELGPKVDGRRCTLLLLSLESFRSACGACNQATTNHHDPSPSFRNYRPTFFLQDQNLPSSYSILSLFYVSSMNERLIIRSSRYGTKSSSADKSVRPATTFPAARRIPDYVSLGKDGSRKTVTSLKST